MDEDRINEGLMNQQPSKEAQLRALKLLQEQQQEIFHKRMQVMRDPSELKELSQLILERKQQIENLEREIQAEKVQKSEEKDISEYGDNTQETSLVKVDEKVSIFQAIRQKLSQFKERFEGWLYKESPSQRARQVEPKTVNDYEFFAKYNDNTEKKSWELSPEKLSEIRQGQVQIANKYNSNEKLVKTEEKNKVLSGR